MAGKLIRLFLVDGQPNGLRTIEISNMTIHGTIFPRTQLDKFMMRESARKPGVYMLLGVDEKDPEKKVLYIGEGDPVLPRLKSHAISKDFWTEAIVFSSKDDYLTKTQVKYLEAEIYAMAKEAYRAILDNAQIPSKPNISEVDKAEVDQFLDAIKLLLLALGIDILEPRILVEENTIAVTNAFELKSKNALARMAIINNKYVVLKGSSAVVENRPSIPTFIVKLRQDLIDTGIMQKEGNVFTFTQDATFNSPSYAAAAIVGGAANGRKLWKREGKMLKEYDKELTDNVADNE